MFRLTSILLLISATSVFGFTPRATTSVVQKNTALKESFGFSFAEDQAENTPIELLGEANYKQYVGEVTENSFLNRQVRTFLMDCHTTKKEGVNTITERTAQLKCTENNFGDQATTSLNSNIEK